MKKTNTLDFGFLSRKVGRFLLVLLMLFFIAFSLFPFVYMLLIAFIKDAYIMRMTWDYIKQQTFTFMNFVNALSYGKMFKYTMNSAIVSAIACLTTCLLSSMAAYAFVKKRFWGHSKIYILYLATMMVPQQVIVIPLYLQIRDMGLLNTFWATAVPTACSAFGVILLTSFMKGVPDELLEAAEIDGCSEIYKFTRIVIPLMKPALISLTIFTFINTWGSMFWPMISTTKTDRSVLTVALTRMIDPNNAVDYGYVMASNTLAFMPPFILYCILQKQFVEGIALSGTKG